MNEIDKKMNMEISKSHSSVSGRERLNHERLIFMYSQFVGSVVDVLMNDMTMYNGQFFTLSTKDDSIVLRYTTIISSCVNVKQYPKDTTLIIPLKEVVKIVAKNIRIKNSSVMLMDVHSRVERERIVPGGVYDPQNIGSSKAAMGKLHFVPFPDPKSKTAETSKTSKNTNETGDNSKTIASPSSTTKTKKPVIGELLPFPQLRPEFQMLINHQTPPRRPTPVISREEQIAQFRKFQKAFDKQFGVTLFPRHADNGGNTKVKQINEVNKKRVMKNEIPTLSQELSHTVASPTRVTAELRENPRENPRENSHENGHENYPARRERENTSHRERRENRQSYLQQQQQQQQQQAQQPSLQTSQQHPIEEAYHSSEKIYSPRNIDREGKMENNRHMNRKNPSRYAQPPIDQTQPYPSPSSQTVPSYQNQPSSASNTPSQQYQQQIPQQIPQQQIPQQQQQQQQQPMVVGAMQMMPQGSDMQVMMVQLMNPDGTVVLQPMMVQGGQLYSMPYMMYPPGQMVQSMVPQNLVYNDPNQMGYLMGGIPNVQGMQNVQGMPYMPMMPMMQVQGMPMQNVQGMPALSIPGVPGTSIPGVPGTPTMTTMQNMQGMPIDSPAEVTSIPSQVNEPMAVSRQDAHTIQSSDSPDQSNTDDSVVNMINRSEYAPPMDIQPPLYTQEPPMPSQHEQPPYGMNVYPQQRQPRDRNNNRQRGNRNSNRTNNTASSYGEQMNEIGYTNNKRRSGKSGEAHFRNNVRNGNQGMNNQHVNQQGKNFNRSYNKNNENYGDMNRRNDANSHGRRPNL